SGNLGGPLLQVRNLEVVYDDVMLVLRGVSIRVPPGQIVALLGANGDGEITKGTVTLDDRPLHGLRPAAIVRRGIAQVMEGRRTFAELTVEENLRVAAHT